MWSTSECSYRRHQRSGVAAMMVARMLVFARPASACWPRPTRHLAGRGADAEYREFSAALEALRAVPAILGDKESLINILASLRRMAIAFSVALVVSIPLGLMMGRNRFVASFFNPLLMITYPVPKAALMPIIMLWLGVGDIAKMLVIFLGVSLPVIYQVFRAPRRSKKRCCGRVRRWASLRRDG